MIFDNFNFSVLDLESYKEDSVREDIIAPILRKVGYAAMGRARMERSKSLIHPFVKIGSKDHPIHIIPDYTLYWGPTPLLVLEAKAPSEKILNSRHVEQAYSYAVHPDIRAPFYGLCNGRHLIVYAVSEWAPILSIPVQEVDSRWDEVVKTLNPKYLTNPDLRKYKADYGMALLKSGLKSGILVLVPESYWQMIIRVEDGLYMSCASCTHGDMDCLISFDFSETILQRILSNLPHSLKEQILESLRQQPYHVELGGRLVVGSVGNLGRLTSCNDEDFVPIIIHEVSKVLFDPSIELK